MPKLSVAEQTRKRVEAVRAQRESEKEAAMVKVAREVEEKELKRKEAIKETERSMSEKGQVESVTDPSGVLDSGDQQEHGDRAENVTMGVRGENEDSASEGDSKNSLQVDDMILGSGDVGNDSLGLTSDQQSLCEYFEEGGESCPSTPLGVVEDVLEGEEDVDERTSDKPRAPPEAATAATEGQAPETPHAADEVGRSTGTHESVDASASDVAMGLGEDTAGSISGVKGGGIEERLGRPAEEEELPASSAAHVGGGETVIRESPPMSIISNQSTLVEVSLTSGTAGNDSLFPVVD